MKGYNEAFQDIPGTVVFDATQSRLGYHLNQFCMSLMKAENREAFKAGERAYLAKWPMTEEQRQAVLDRDYNRMIALGGNIYFLAKIGATDGFSSATWISFSALLPASRAASGCRRGVCAAVPPSARCRE